MASNAVIITQTLRSSLQTIFRLRQIVPHVKTVLARMGREIENARECYLFERGLTL